MTGQIYVYALGYIKALVWVGAAHVAIAVIGACMSPFSSQILVSPLLSVRPVRSIHG